MTAPHDRPLPDGAEGNPLPDRAEGNPLAERAQRDEGRGTVVPLPTPLDLTDDLVQDQPVTIRFSTGEIVVDAARPAGFLLELERPGRSPWVEVRGPGLHVRALLDTTSGTSLVDPAFAAAHPDAFAGLIDGRAMMAECRIGGRTFEAVEVLVDDPAEHECDGEGWPITLVLGLPHLRQADWYLDVPGNAWAVLDPADDEDDDTDDASTEA